MVLAEKGSDNARNGRRSRGPSPNGHVAAESTSDEETVPVDKIRVGRDYQAVCPPLQPVELRRPETLQDRALLVWSPTVDIAEQKLDEYITLAKEKYGYNGEQALGMLFWHKHDLDRAILDLANFTPFPDEWSVEDKVLFEQAFQFHGKSFHRIRQMLPDKTIASLVKYYYSWKKTRTRTSLMDKQARKLTSTRDEAASEGGSEGGGSNEESDADDKVQINKQSVSILKQKTNEGVADLRPESDSSRINARWTQEELLLAVQGIRKYGKDFKSIAEVLGTKTETHMRSFFVNYRKRFNLDHVLKEYESEHGIVNSSTNDIDEKMEVDNPDHTEAMDVIESAGTQPATSSTTSNGSVSVIKISNQAQTQPTK